MAERLYIPLEVRNTVIKGIELQRRFNRDLLYGKSVSTTEILKLAANLLANSYIDNENANLLYKFFKDIPNIDNVAKKENGKPTSEVIKWFLHGGKAGKQWIDSVYVNKEIPAENQVSIEVDVQKVDRELGIVFGYAIVCKIGNEDYFDTQGDHIPEQSMLEATSDFMSGERTAKVMHAGEPAGQVVYGFPLTHEIAKALDIEVNKSGFIVGMKPDSSEVLNKFATGEFTGFSIGGRRLKDTEISA
jgi:hypothetical protein